MHDSSAPAGNDLSQALERAQQLHLSGKLSEAEQAYTQILRQDRSQVDAWKGLAVLAEQSGRGHLAADAHAELGRVLIDQGRIQEAEQSLCMCLQHKGDHRAARSQLSLIYWEWNRLDDAEEFARSVLELEPNEALAWQTLGLVACKRDAPQDAVDAFKRALSVRPDLVLSHNYLGICFNQLGRFDEALAQFEATLRLQPGNPYAHFNRALAWLAQGRFRDGWVDYEWRFRSGQTTRPSIPCPQWDGSPLEGRGLLVHTEQGMGDVLQFVRLLPLVKEQGGRVVFACQKPLQPLLSRCDAIDQWFPIDEPAPIDFELQVPLISLAGLLGIDADNCPTGVPYLTADPQRVEAWRSRIESISGFKVGVCWHGSHTFSGDRLRSIPLRHFADLAGMTGVTLINLQKGHGVEELDTLKPECPIHILDGLDESGGAFMDTAAVMQHLDLVITSDTSIAHLAGALGRAVWVALSTAADWRWLRDRTDSPWYPSMRLFRQRTLGDWTTVFAEMAEALQAASQGSPDGGDLQGDAVESRPRTDSTVMVEIAPGELIDKITILEIKLARITDESKRQNVRRELAALTPPQDRLLSTEPALAPLANDLRTINEELWEIEDTLRECERTQDFGNRFVDVARSVYRMNDRRSQLKREINVLLDSPILEEKSYGCSR